MSWVGSASHLLQNIGRPTRVAPLAWFLKENGWVATRARNPTATLRSSIYQDLRKRADRGEEQHFFMRSGVVGLVEYEPKSVSLEVQEQYVDFERAWAVPRREEHPSLPRAAAEDRAELPSQIRPMGAARRHYEMFVWFATDRKRETDTRPGHWFGSQRASLSYGRVTVSIPDRHRVGRVERPPWWRRRENVDRDLVVMAGEEFPESGFLTSIRDELSKRKPEVLVFVHGYNVSFGDAVLRTAQIAYDLKYKGVPVCFSWPSKGGRLRYMADEASNEWSEPDLAGVLSLLSSLPLLDRLHLLTHSMGGRNSANVIESAVKEGQKWPSKLTQLIFAAPDIDSGVFERIVSSFSTIERATMYASSNDPAMKISTRFHEYARAGDVANGRVVVVDGLDTIDASNQNPFLGHTYYAGRWGLLSDISLLIDFGHDPDSRFGLRRMQYLELPYWVFALA